mmetsp:Transcript_135787/g.434414  ORF Transcript_135787/g.434414 Transcript_135787/m.434414 type:complete len:281 (+) Transcript_135787:1458-2300(+)
MGHLTWQAWSCLHCVWQSMMGFALSHFSWMTVQGFGHCSAQAASAPHFLLQAHMPRMASNQRCVPSPCSPKAPLSSWWCSRCFGQASWHLSSAPQALRHPKASHSERNLSKGRGHAWWHVASPAHFSWHWRVSSTFWRILLHWGFGHCWWQVWSWPHFLWHSASGFIFSHFCSNQAPRPGLPPPSKRKAWAASVLNAGPRPTKTAFSRSAALSNRCSPEMARVKRLSILFGKLSPERAKSPRPDKSATKPCQRFMAPDAQTGCCGRGVGKLLDAAADQRY